MQIIYTAPGRGHHYIYAEAFYQADTLAAFVSGFSRFSPRANNINVGDKLARVDFLQNIYLTALRYHLPKRISDELAYRAKIQQDKACGRFIDRANVFLFYNGSGLHTLSKAKSKGLVTIVEAVNSHVEYQEAILRNEYRELGLPWIPFHKNEKKRRMLEYEKADYILLPSEFVKNSFLSMGFPDNKLLKVPYGFNSFNPSDKQLGSEKDMFTVLYVGSISVRKGLKYLVEAFQKLSISNKKLIITGAVSYPNGLESVSMSSNIIFTGVLKGKDLQNVYSSADVFCLPSIEEGLALVLGEALSFGLPIIATQNTGASDIFTDGEEGFIVPIKSSEAIQEKLELLVNDSRLSADMRVKAQKKASLLQGWKETQQNLVKTICELSE